VKRSPASLSACLAFSFALAAAGCISPSVRIEELDEAQDLGITLECNSRVASPRLRLKFYVDIVNQSGSTVDLNDLSVELVASPRGEPSRVLLARTWEFQWPKDVVLRPGKRATLPIVPEVETHRIATGAVSEGVARHRVQASNFPVGELVPGEYEVRAAVNGRHVSASWVLRVEPPAQPRIDGVPVAPADRGGPPPAARVR
jgi:hypothetical protein